MSRFGKALIAIAVSGVLQTLSFPVAGPLPFWRAQLSWIALVPWLVVVLRQSGPHRFRNGVLLSYFCGILWYLGHCYWVYQTMHLYGGLSVPMAVLVLFLFCCYLGLYHALFGAVLLAVTRRGRWHDGKSLVLIVPVLWVAVELARARVTSFPWDLLGYAQIDNMALTRMASFAGTYALSFVVALINGMFAVGWLRTGVVRRRMLASAAVAAVALCALSLVVPKPRLGPADQQAVLVQPNLTVGTGAAMEQAPQLARALSALSVAPKPGAETPRLFADRKPAAVILWPESPAPFDVADLNLASRLSLLAVQQHTPVIAGAEAIESDRTAARGYRLYNAAAVFQADGRFTERYDKIHLVPFGEFLPYAQLFWFAGGLTQEVGRFDRGHSRSGVAVGAHRFGLFLCYESIFGDEVRQFVQNGADVLVNLSDDGWYGDTSAPFQHINMARMRAIENHRWILRDTNTGISASIDPAGRVHDPAPRHIRTAVLVPFAYDRTLTFYTRHGDVFAYACALATAALLVFGFVPSRRSAALN